jgi:hypothetical protein
MSETTTTETPEPRPPNLHFGAVASAIHAGSVWTDEHGDTHGALRFTGYSDIVFHDPSQPRHMAALLEELAAAMEAEAARAAAEKTD